MTQLLNSRIKQTIAVICIGYQKEHEQSFVRGQMYQNIVNLAVDIVAEVSHALIFSLSWAYTVYDESISLVDCCKLSQIIQCSLFEMDRILAHLFTLALICSLKSIVGWKTLQKTVVLRAKYAAQESIRFLL